jgi:hypothetical protein
MDCWADALFGTLVQSTATKRGLLAPGLPSLRLNDRLHRIRHCLPHGPYETLPGVSETPGNGVFFSGETTPDTARYTPIWQPQVSLCSMPVLVVNRPL